MKEKPWIKYNGTINVKKGLTQLPESIVFVVFIKEEIAVLSFPKKYKRVLKQLVKKEKSDGYDIQYYKEKNIAIERYPNKSAQEIGRIIGAEMKKSGGKLNAI